MSVRWLAHRDVELGLALEYRRTASSSAVFASRAYEISAYGVEPRIDWQPAPRWSITTAPVLSLRYAETATEPIRLVRIPLSTRWTGAGGTLLSGRLEFNDVSGAGAARPVGLTLYELTDGRGMGSSWLWSLRAQREIGGGIRLNASYDGRTVADAPTIHTIRVEVQATF